MGNTVTSPTPPGAEGSATVTAKQEINPTVLGDMSDYYGKPGSDVLHEVTEAYHGAKVSQAFGVDSPSAKDATSVYPQAHDAATKQSGPQYYEFKDKNGNNSGSNLYKNGTGTYFAEKKGSQPLILQTYP